MDVTTAVELVNGLIYKPTWLIEASDYTARHEGALLLQLAYDAQDTCKANAATGYTTMPVRSQAKSIVLVGDCSTPEQLLYRVFQRIMEFESHEAREAFRTENTLWGPFNPHRIDGQKRWAAATGQPVDADLLFGIA